MSPPDGEDITTSITRELMTHTGFRRLLVRGGIGKQGRSNSLYVKDVTDFVQNPVVWWGKDDIMFQTERGNALLRAALQNMTAKCTRTSYKEVKKAVLGSGDTGSV